MEFNDIVTRCIQHTDISKYFRVSEKVNVGLVDFHQSVIMYFQISCERFFLELLSEKKIV